MCQFCKQYKAEKRFYDTHNYKKEKVSYKVRLVINSMEPDTGRTATMMCPPMELRFCPTCGKSLNVYTNGENI